MGCYAVGSECCNNCVHWNCHTERRFRGNPPKDVYTESNCDKCRLTDRNTLSENTCGMFCHIGGIKNTFAVASKRRSGDVAGAMIAGVDESSRSMLQATIDYIRDVEVQKREEEKLCVGEDCEIESEEEDLDGDAEREFARTMEELGRANDRARELVDEGMDYRYMLKDKAVEFMHLLDRAKRGAAIDQYRFARAFIDGSHGAIKEGSYDAGTRYFREVLHHGYSLAYYWCRKAAERGFARAEYLLGTLERDGKNDGHNDGEFASKDYLSALKWFSLAFKHGCKDAQDAYRKMRIEVVGNADKLLVKGFKFLLGLDCECNVSEGLKQVRLASKQVKGDVTLDKVEGELVKKVLESMSELADQGELTVLDALGMMYSHYPDYKKIVAEDLCKAFSYFKKSAEAGCPAAMNHLGYCYETGEGVDKDEILSSRWYAKAARRGSMGGQVHYAKCLMRGRGVQKNEREAMHWYVKAAANGSSSALLFLTECAQSGKFMKEDPVLAFEWCQSAARAGSAEAMHKLGFFYGKGYGCEKNATLESEWEKKAVANGYESW